MMFTYGDLIKARRVLKQFQETKTDEDIFYELCFCLCAPQTTFKKNIEVLDSLRKFHLFHWASSAFRNERWVEITGRQQLEQMLKPVRFYKQKADRIIKAMENFSEILDFVRFAVQNGYASEFNFRTWLVKNVKGLGYKTASHFLRNLGADGFAIIDAHVLRYMKIGDKKWDYLEVEKKFCKRAKRYGITAAELDAIVWKTYSKTDWSGFIH